MKRKNLYTEGGEPKRIRYKSKIGEITMKQFYQKVDLRSRKAMVYFLSTHFRYHTMNSWNCSTSYANKIKIHSLGLDSETEDKLYDMLDVDGFWDDIRWVLEDFAYEHRHQWQIGTNGRSGGYLVLYKGGVELTGYKSYCTNCYQQNFTSVTENNNFCGKCHQPTRKDYSKPHTMVVTYPGKSTDEYEDFEDWNMQDLRERVKLVQSFDRATDNLVAAAVYIAKNFSIEEEEYTVPHTRKVLVEKGAA